MCGSAQNEFERPCTLRAGVRRSPPLTRVEHLGPWLGAAIPLQAIFLPLPAARRKALGTL